MIIKKQEGSFLLEFLIALGIFSIAITGLVKLQNRAISDLSDLGSDMAIPILIDDFTARVNLSSDNKVEGMSLNELRTTANAMMKNIQVDVNKITITDMINPSKTAVYEVVIDKSGK